MKSKSLFASCILILNLFSPFLWRGAGGDAYAQHIAGGDAHSLAICNDSTVRAWGWNLFGQLGDNTNTDRWAPVQVLGPAGIGFLTGITALAAGDYHSIALKNDSTVWAWGNNNYGQLGDNTAINSNTPVQVLGPGGIGFLTGITALAAGENHSIALKNDSTVWDWGRNLYGELGDNTATQKTNPVQVLGPGGIGFLTGITAIAAGGEHSLALKNDGTVWEWGFNLYGQLGDNTTTNRKTPVQVLGPGGISFLNGITAVAGGDNYSLALKNDGTVWAWGYNNYGQLGDNTTMDRKTPVQVLGPGGIGFLNGITAVAGGEFHSLALKNNGRVWGWGYNIKGQLGDNTNSNSSTPVQVLGPGGIGFLSGITALPAEAEYHSMALKNDGTVWDWGWNLFGQLGDNTNTDRWAPVQVINLCAVTGLQTLSLTANSTALYCNGQCTGTATAIPAGGTSPYTYNWNTSPVQTTKTATGLCAGSYTVTVTDAANSSITATVTITQPPPLSSVVSLQTNVSCNAQCTGAATISASGGTAGYTYSWVPAGRTNAAVTGLCAAAYTVVVTDAKGCIQTQTLAITEPAAITTSVSATDSFCNNNNGSAMVSASGGTGTFSYNWSPGGQTISVVTGFGAGTYTVTVSDANGCSQNETVTVIEQAGPTATALQSVTIMQGNSTILNATGGGTYNWLPTTGLSCSTCFNPTASPTATTIYCVFVTDANNCSDSDCVTINVEIPCGEIFVPTAFSPNDDAANNLECLYGNCIKTLTFIIYNRWGEKVFETNDPKACWNGTYKGKPMNSGVFVYYIRAVLISGEEISRKGNISLIR